MPCLLGSKLLLDILLLCQPTCLFLLLTPYTQLVEAWAMDRSHLLTTESSINGNTPDYVKQLNYNTFMSYGVGEEDGFGYTVGKTVRFGEVNMTRNKKVDRQKLYQSPRM